MTQPPPSGCRHCGIPAREHAQRWTTGVGWHQHTPPTQDQIKARMRARAAQRETPMTNTPPQPEPDDPTQCSGEEGFCPEHGFHRHTLKQPGTADRAAVLADDEGDELVCVDQCGSCDACGMEPFGTPAEGWRQAAHFLRRTARESGDRAGALHGARLIEAELRRLADEAQQQERSDVGTPEDRCAECGHFQGAHEEAEEPVSVGRCTVCADDDAWHNYEATEEERRLAGARRQPDAASRPEPPVHGESVAHLAGDHDDEPTIDAQTLADLFEGFGRLLATSSRDWGQYRVDAWLYAVILGWDCEETVHDETCTHGAMEEMQRQHGWSDEAVAKARRYRAAVRALTQPTAGAGQDGAAADEPAPRPCRTFVSGGTVWCCEEGETDCPCVCHQPATARQDGARQ